MGTIEVVDLTKTPNGVTEARAALRAALELQKRARSSTPPPSAEEIARLDRAVVTAREGVATAKRLAAREEEVRAKIASSAVGFNPTRFYEEQMSKRFGPDWKERARDATFAPIPWKGNRK